MTPIAATTSQSTIVIANPSRNFLSVFNQSPATMYMSITTGFTRGNAPIVIQPNKTWKMPYLYRGAFYAQWDAAAGFAQVVEL